MGKYKYCPRCGESLTTIKENLDECRACNFSFYHNVAASVVAMIFNESGELLMVQRANDPGKGKWSLPGGFIDYNESAEEGLAREIEEETGLKITKFEYWSSTPGIYWFQEMGYRTLMMTFKAELPRGQTIKISEESTAWKWVEAKDINLDEVGNEDVREVMGRWKESVRQNNSYFLISA